MTFEAYITLAVVAAVVGLLVFSRYAADVILLGGLTLLLAVGVVTPAEALAGLGNPGLVTVGVLFVVAAGMRETGGMGLIAQRLLGRPRSLTTAGLRLAAPVTAMSALLNNTPVVAMFIPTVADWARRCRFSVSKLMMPLSFAAILGGLCTLIGTSTNLVVNGLWITEAGRESLGLFEIAWIGVPCAAAGLVYLLTVGRWLLPERKPPISLADDPRQYTAEMVVEPDGPLVGRTIEQAGLRHLPGLYLMEIERGERIISAVSPTETLHGDDRLVFVGIVESVVDLRRIRGLRAATEQVFRLDTPRTHRCLIEAVVSDTCPLVGRSIREGRFRSHYQAAVIAVARNGERVRKKIGDIVLRPGDTLLLETRPSFIEQQRNRRDFFLVSKVEDSTPPRHEKALTAVLILVAMVAAVAGGLLPMMTAAMLAAGLMIITRCVTASSARRSVDWSVLLVIAAAFGIGRAMQASGLAETTAASLVSMAGANPMAALAAVIVITVVFTELMTNNAAAVLVFPIALATASDLEVSPMPFVIAIMVAASASFLTPIGYQTNLMVYGPGGYRFTDYFRVGLPLTLIVAVLTWWLVPMIWGF